MKRCFRSVDTGPRGTQDVQPIRYAIAWVISQVAATVMDLAMAWLLMLGSEAVMRLLGERAIHSDPRPPVPHKSKPFEICLSVAQNQA